MKILEAEIINPSLAGLVLAYALVAVVVVILHRHKHEVIRDVYLASVRMALQLFAVGFVLAALFRLNRWYGGFTLADRGHSRRLFSFRRVF